MKTGRRAVMLRNNELSRVRAELSMCASALASSEEIMRAAMVRWNEAQAHLVEMEKLASELASALRDELSAARKPLDHPSLVAYYARRSAREGQEGTR